MTSVSTFFLAERNRYSFQTLNVQLADLQRQASSGYRADSVQGYGGDVGRLLSARETIAVAEARVEAARQLEPRLGLQDLAIGRLEGAVQQVRSAIENALAADNGLGLDSALEGAFDAAADALSQRFGETFVFGGERVGQNPVTVSSLTALAALPSAAEAFQNAARPQTFDYGQGGATPIAPLASELATDFFEALREIRGFVQTNELDPALTNDQRDQLWSFVDQLRTVQEDVLQRQASNGVLQNRTEELALQEEARVVLFKGALGEVADADLAEVAARMSQLRTQFEASAEVFNQVRQLSLLNFLR